MSEQTEITAMAMVRQMENYELGWRQIRPPGARVADSQLSTIRDLI